MYPCRGLSNSRCWILRLTVGAYRTIRAFALPWFRRFDGYAAWSTIFLRCRPTRAHDDLVCHELCHVWQMQHHPLGMPLSYLRSGYARNPFEAEARRAVESTRG